MLFCLSILTLILLKPYYSQSFEYDNMYKYSNQNKIKAKQHLQINQNKKTFKQNWFSKRSILLMRFKRRICPINLLKLK